MNRLLERTFENRGYMPGFLEDINRCGHSVARDTDKLCQILKYYHDTQGLVVLLTDFDTDGICCGVEGLAGLSELGFNVALFIPDVNDGYGFHDTTIDTLVSQYPNVRAILTADVGATCFAGVNRARQLGIDILVTDHHIPKGILNATVFVDPRREDDVTSYGDTCGAYVLYNVLLSYAERYTNPYKVEQIRRLSVFAGCGTVSDSMPMRHENRMVVKDTLDMFKFLYHVDKNKEGDRTIVDCIVGHPIYRRAFLGLYILLDTFRENGNFVMNTVPLDIREDFIGYYMAPALNSIKRMGASMDLVYGVFFGTSPYQCMQRIIDLNDARKVLVQEKFADIMENKFPQPWAPYIYVTDAEGGIRGLLAQKVTEVTGEPAIVIGPNPNGSYKGSGRCPEWYPFLDVAGGFAEWYAAGHNPAFGIGFDDEAGCDALYAYLRQTIPKLKPSRDALAFKPDYVVSMFGDGDGCVDAGLVEDYLSDLEQCRPFGPGFEEPVGMLRINPQLCEFSFMSNQKHVKIHLPMGISVVCFNQGHMLKDRCVYRKRRIDESLYEDEVERKEDGSDKKKDSGKKDGESGGDEVVFEHSYWMANDLPDCLEVVGKFGYNTYNGVRTIQFVGDIVTPLD